MSQYYLTPTMNIMIVAGMMASTRTMIPVTNPVVMLFPLNTPLVVITSIIKTNTLTYILDLTSEP